MGTGRAAGTRKEAVAGVTLGTSATKVPKMMSTTPAQIQPTRGLRMALMMGWPVRDWCLHRPRTDPNFGRE